MCQAWLDPGSHIPGHHFLPALSSAFLLLESIAWGQVRVQGDLISLHDSEPVSVAREHHGLSAFELSKLAHLWSWGLESTLPKLLQVKSQGDTS